MGEAPDPGLQAGTLKVHPPRPCPDLPAPHPRPQADRQRPLLPGPAGLPEAHRLLQQVALRRRPPRTRQAQEHDQDPAETTKTKNKLGESVFVVSFCSHQKNSSSILTEYI